jgi:hypothetical protein
MNLQLIENAGQPFVFKTKTLNKYDVKIKSIFASLALIKTHNPNKYGRLKMMGDAYLRVMVYKFIESQNFHPERSLQSLSAEMIEGKTGDDLMPLFFDTYAPPALTGEQSGPSTQYGSHAKADFIEAMLIYTLTTTHFAIHSFILRWIMFRGKNIILSRA